MKTVKSSTISRALYLIGFILFLSTQAISQSHPRVWVSQADKAQILENIDQYTWAKSMFDQLKDRQDGLKNSHKSNPRTYLNTLPSSLPSSNRTMVLNNLNNAGECAILYYLTGDEDYAQLAADVLHHYTQRVKNKNALDKLFFTTDSGNDSFNQTRESQPRLALIYDFIQPFLAKSTTRVYNVSGSNRVRFSFDDIQTVFEKLADHVLLLGGMNSNHTLFETPGGLFPIICMPDANKRATYFNKIINGDTRHRSMDWCFEQFSEEEGIWMESLSYGKASHVFFLMTINIIDKYAPNLDLVEKYKSVLDGVFELENFNYPNGQMMSFGDSKRHDADNTDALRMVLAIADRKGYANLKTDAMDALGTLYHKQGGYKPVIETQRFTWTNPLQLMWGVNVLETAENNIPLFSTVRAKHAGIIAQRNFEGNDQEKDGLMYYTGGGDYVHTHPCGIDMELYGRGYIIGPEYGWVNAQDEHAFTYAKHHAAHNTVIVNGVATVGPRTGPSSWQNLNDEVILQGVEPQRKEQPLSKNYRFSTQYIDDEWNDCKQLRANAIVRTGPTTGYYVDVFRSKANGQNNFHDYLFHGLGDGMTYKSQGSNLSLTNTPNRYRGQQAELTGWQWFEATKTSTRTTEAVTARFDLNATNDYLHVNIPGTVEREYSSALAPPTAQALNGYDRKDTRMMIMRKYGEAWNQPFVALYEPSGSPTASVQSSELLQSSGKVVGVKVTSIVAGQVIVDYVISADKDGTSISLDNEEITFNGRFGIVRSIVQPEKETVELYLGKGNSLSYKGEVLNGGNNSKGFRSFELTDKVGPEGYVFVTDEGNLVQSNVPMDIAYGANGEFNYLYNQRDGVSCVNGTFGDPIPGVQKSCYIKESKTHYGDLPALIPGVIEAEHYDYGGKGVSFWDRSDENKGASEANFRVENGIDIGLGNGGLVLSWIGVGEWTEYTVDVATSATYEVTFHISSDNSEGRMRLEMDGQEILSDLAVPNTGSFDNYSAMTTELNLTEGEHVLRVNYEVGGFELDKIVTQEKFITGVTNKSNPQIAVYPNPSTGIFTLNRDVEWELFSIQGKLLFSDKGAVIELGNYGSGTYLLRCQGEFIKLVKE